MQKHVAALPLLVLAGGWSLLAGQPHFDRFRVTNEFWGEGADFADFNRDGHKDVVYGPLWFEGPDFKTRHELAPAGQTFTRKGSDGADEMVPGYEGALGSRNAYSNCFFCFTDDFNHDTWPDVLIIGLPGEPCFWYENPKNQPGHWRAHPAIQVPDNESPDYLDVTGDGRPEVICCSGGCLGYAHPDPANPVAPWTFIPVSAKGSYHKYSHGLGAGDIDGDGRLDLIESNGWYQQPASLDGNPLWKWHPFVFCPPTDQGIAVGGAQMFAYDVNGDGLNDVITSIACHGYGLAWYEQVRDGDRIDFKRRLFVNKTPAENPYGVSFSQPHALDLADIDGDGLKDLITGKRFWAHGPQGDVEPNAPAVLYWFKLTRGPNGAEFVPHRVDSDSGVGTQVKAADLNGDGRADIVVGNKKGLHVFVQRP
ncbi:MAG: VCBS repeat-containing protein [Verrucomicrobiales bacterium]|nr:VCBS repeat-containing protein [Verrucomicrobiales bacterium]MCP5528553.1 VCBS repeat-containing protein [Verrucomicrobiales bacterium]